MNRITIVNTNPHEFRSEHYDFSLPTIYHHYGMVMLNSQIKPNSPERTVEVSGDKTIRQTFEDQGFKLMDGRILGVRILPTPEHPNPMNYFPGGFYPSNSIIVPDHLKWEELFEWVNKLEDLCQTEFFPIAAAPKEEIESFVRKMLAEKGRN